MKVKVYEGCSFLNDESVNIWVDETDILEVREKIDSSPKQFLCFHKPTESIVVMYEDEIFEYTADMEMTDRLAGACTVKRENQIRAQELVAKETAAGLRPSPGDEVRFSTGTKDGTLLEGDEVRYGKVLDVEYITDTHLMYMVQENDTNLAFSVVINHRHGWYSADKIQTMKSLTKEFEYYGVYDARNNKVVLDSLYVHKSDTEAYARSMTGEPVPSYLEVRKVKLSVLPE